MAIKLKHSNTFSTYFIPFTCVDWIPLFEITNGYDMVYNWFTVIKNDYNAAIVFYVIMPNHLHVILHFHDDKFDLNAIVANGKRFMAYEMINRLEHTGNAELLLHLGDLLTNREIKKGQLHKVFKESFDAKQLSPITF